MGVRARPMPGWGRPPQFFLDAVLRSDAGEGTPRAPQRVPRRVQPGSVVTAAPSRCRAIFLEDLLQYSQLLEDLLQYSQLLEDLLQYSQLLEDLLQYSQLLEDLLQYSQ